MSELFEFGPKVDLQRPILAFSRRTRRLQRTQWLFSDFRDIWFELKFHWIHRVLNSDSFWSRERSYQQAYRALLEELNVPDSAWQAASLFALYTILRTQPYAHLSRARLGPAEWRAVAQTATALSAVTPPAGTPHPAQDVIAVVDSMLKFNLLVPAAYPGPVGLPSVSTAAAGALGLPGKLPENPPPTPAGLAAATSLQALHPIAPAVASALALLASVPEGEGDAPPCPPRPPPFVRNTRPRKAKAPSMKNTPPINPLRVAEVHALWSGRRPGAAPLLRPHGGGLAAHTEGSSVVQRLIAAALEAITEVQVDPSLRGSESTPPFTPSQERRNAHRTPPAAHSAVLPVPLSLPAFIKPFTEALQIAIKAKPPSSGVVPPLERLLRIVAHAAYTVPMRHAWLGHVASTETPAHIAAMAPIMSRETTAALTGNTPVGYKCGEGVRGGAGAGAGFTTRKTQPATASNKRGGRKRARSDAPAPPHQRLGVRWNEQLASAADSGTPFALLSAAGVLSQPRMAGAVYTHGPPSRFAEGIPLAGAAPACPATLTLPTQPQWLLAALCPALLHIADVGTGVQAEHLELRWAVAPLEGYLQGVLGGGDAAPPTPSVVKLSLSRRLVQLHSEGAVVRLPFGGDKGGQSQRRDWWLTDGEGSAGADAGADEGGDAAYPGGGDWSVDAWEDANSPSLDAGMVVFTGSGMPMRVPFDAFVHRQEQPPAAQRSRHGSHGSAHELEAEL